MFDNVADNWKWTLDFNVGYSVKDGYHIPIYKDQIGPESTKSLIWNKITLLKVSMFAWKLINYKISTKAKWSDKNNTFKLKEVYTWMQKIWELSTYIPLLWVFFFHIWSCVLQWLRILCVHMNDIIGQTLQFFGSHSFSKEHCKCFQIIWLARIWVFREETNLHTFKNNE